MRKTGYNKEEEYFHKLNQEQIDKKRKHLDDQRAKQLTRDEKPQYWLRCPKCGQQMEEVDLQGIKVDRCSGCQGIYFDQGELELLIQGQESGGLLGSFKKLFG